MRLISRCFGCANPLQPVGNRVIIQTSFTDFFTIMNFLVKIIQHIHTWPEEARKLLAIGLMIIAGIVMFNGWSTRATARLQDLSPTQPKFAFENVQQQAPLRLVKDGEQQVVPEQGQSLVGGVVDTIKSLGQWSPAPKTAKTAPAPQSTATGNSFFASAGDFISAIPVSIGQMATYSYGLILQIDVTKIGQILSDAWQNAVQLFWQIVATISSLTQGTGLSDLIAQVKSYALMGWNYINTILRGANITF